MGKATISPGIKRILATRPDCAGGKGVCGWWSTILALDIGPDGDVHVRRDDEAPKAWEVESKE